MLAVAELLLVVAELTLQLVHAPVHPRVGVRVVMVGDEQVAMLGVDDQSPRHSRISRYFPRTRRK